MSNFGLPSQDIIQEIYSMASELRIMAKCAIVTSVHYDIFHLISSKSLIYVLEFTMQYIQVTYPQYKVNFTQTM